MAQYIDKDALVAWAKETYLCENASMIRKVCYKQLLEHLDTLEVKEVNLENELKEDWLFADKTEVDCLECMCLTEDMFVSLAKKYFELGMSVSNKAQKG